MRLALRREIVSVFSNELFAEYEGLLGRESIFATGSLSRREEEKLLDALASVSRRVSTWFLRRPNLPDWGDENPMSTLTIRLEDEQHERLRALAKQRGVGLNTLFEEFTARAIAEFDTETRCRARAERGDAARDLAILDALDRHHDA